MSNLHKAIGDIAMHSHEKGAEELKKGIFDKHFVGKKMTFTTFEERGTFTEEAWEKVGELLSKHNNRIGKGVVKNQISTGLRNRLLDTQDNTGKTVENYEKAHNRSSPELYIMVNSEGLQALKDMSKLEYTGGRNSVVGVFEGVPVHINKWSSGIVIIKEGKVIFSLELK